jgi:hypothetical protein
MHRKDMSYTHGLTSSLGIEPDTVNHLNGGSAQQDSIVSFNGKSIPTAIGSSRK